LSNSSLLIFAPKGPLKSDILNIVKLKGINFQ
jgi:hypothetical protein